MPEDAIGLLVGRRILLGKMLILSIFVSVIYPETSVFSAQLSLIITLDASAAFVLLCFKEPTHSVLYPMPWLSGSSQLY